MSNILDISDPAIQEAMKALDIRPSDLLLKYSLHREKSIFPGPEKIQNLRYKHHIKKVQKLASEIKSYLKSYKNKQLPHENSSFISEFFETEESSTSKIKAKRKLNLSMQINYEKQKRALLTSSMQKLLRKDRVSEKIQLNVDKKRYSELQKKAAIEMRLKSILHEQREKTQDWNRKLSRVSSRVSSVSPKHKKNVSASDRFPKEHEFIALDQLRELNERLERKNSLHKMWVKEGTMKIAEHNEKVEKTLKTQKSIREINEHSKLFQLIEKADEVSAHRLNKQKLLERSLNKKIVKNEKKYSQVKNNLEEEEQKLINRTSRLENKKILQKNILMCQLEELNKEKEYKTVKQKLRDEDAKENLARKRKIDLKKREKLLERQLELHHRFLSLKEGKEKANEKKRYEATQAMHEHTKAKQLYLLLCKSENPDSLSKLLETHY